MGHSIWSIRLRQTTVIPWPTPSIRSQCQTEGYRGWELGWFASAVGCWQGYPLCRSSSHTSARCWSEREHLTSQQLGHMSCWSSIMVGIWLSSLTCHLAWLIQWNTWTKRTLVPWWSEIQTTTQLLSWQVIWSYVNCSHWTFRNLTTSHCKCLIIPRGMQFGSKLFLEIVIPEESCHAIPWSHHRTGSSFYDWAFLQLGPTVPRCCRRLATLYTSGGNTS